MRQRTFGQPHELARCGVESINRAVLDVINPAIKLELTCREFRRGDRVRLKIAELTQDILVNERVEAGAFVRGGR